MPEPVPLPTPAATRPSENGPARFPLQLKNQLTGGDARAERLVRQIQIEIDQLKETLQNVSAEHEAVTIDAAAIAADPAEAVNLPPELLVRALVASTTRTAELQERLAHRETKIRTLRGKVRELGEERAWLRGRLKTFEETMGALHANLEDLRQARNAGLLGKTSLAPGLGTMRPQESAAIAAARTETA